MRQIKMGFGVLVAFFCKLGPKFLALAAKMGKSAKLVKVGLAGSSVAAYSILFSWQFAVILMIFLFIHENGHVWAMRRAGMKIKGIYYIPLLGAAAVGDGYFPNRQSEAHIALMGPLWGLVLCVLTAIIWISTLNPFWGAVTAWMALINLINLLPVNPLDGGRVLKSVVFSLSTTLGRITMVVVGVLALIGFIKCGIYLFAFLVPIGVLEAYADSAGYKTRKKDLEFERKIKVDNIVKSEFITRKIQILEERRVKLQSALISITCPGVQYFVHGISNFMPDPHVTFDEGKKLMEQICFENKEILKINKEYGERIQNLKKEKMNLIRIGLTGVIYFAIVAVFLAMTSLLVGIPGATEAFEMLR